MPKDQAFIINVLVRWAMLKASLGKQYALGQAPLRDYGKLSIFDFTSPFAAKFR